MTVRLRRVGWAATWVAGLALLCAPAQAGGICRSPKCRPMVAAPAAQRVYSWPTPVSTTAPAQAMGSVAGIETLLVPLGIEVVRGMYGEIRRRNESGQGLFVRPTPPANGPICPLSDTSSTQEDGDITDIKTRLEGINSKLGIGPTPPGPSGPTNQTGNPPGPQPSVPDVFPAKAIPPAPNDPL